MRRTGSTTPRGSWSCNRPDPAQSIQGTSAFDQGAACPWAEPTIMDESAAGPAVAPRRAGRFVAGIYKLQSARIGSIAEKARRLSRRIDSFQSSAISLTGCDVANLLMTRRRSKPHGSKSPRAGRATRFIPKACIAPAAPPRATPDAHSHEGLTAGPRRPPTRQLGNGIAVSGHRLPAFRFGFWVWVTRLLDLRIY
jgi:hypothetical protein